MNLEKKERLANLLPSKKDKALFVYDSLRFYNSLCFKCRLIAKRNPNTPYNKYCKECQESAKRILKNYIK